MVVRMLPSSRRAPAARAIASAGSHSASASVPRPSSMSRCPSEARTRARAAGSPVVRQQRNGGAAALEALERLAADPQVAPEALADQRGGHRIGVGVDERQRAAGQCRGAGVLAREVRRLRGAANEVDEARPGGAHVLGHAVPELDRALVVGVGLGEGGQPHGVGARLRRGGERGRQVVGGEPVVGELGGHAGGGDRQPGVGLQRTRQRGVQRPALAGQQVVGQRLAHERVAEAIRAGLRLDDDDVVGHCLAQAADQLVGSDRRGLLEQPMAHPRAGDGREAQHGLCGRAERLDAQHERVGEVGRHTLAGRGGRQLLGEERVALGAGEELVDQPGLGPAAEDPRELGDHLLAGEALERDALDDRSALGLGHQRPQRMAAVQLVGAVGGDEQHALWRALRTKKDRKSREERSAQWTSSKTSMSGCASPNRPSRPSRSSNTRPWESALSWPASGASSWGSSGARPAAPPPSSSGLRPRSALTIGA